MIELGLNWYSFIAGVLKARPAEARAKPEKSGSDDPYASKVLRRLLVGRQLIEDR